MRELINVNRDLKLPKIYKYKYEVISEKSKYYESIDFIYYEQPIREGHSYVVSLNKDDNYPKISKIITEILDKK